LMTQNELDACDTIAKSGPFESSKIWVTGAAKTEMRT